MTKLYQLTDEQVGFIQLVLDLEIDRIDNMDKRYPWTVSAITFPSRDNWLEIRKKLTKPVVVDKTNIKAKLQEIIDNLD